MILLKVCFYLFLLTFSQVLVAVLKEIQPSYSEPVNHSLGELRTGQKSFLPKLEVHLTTASQAKAYPMWGFCWAGWTLCPAPLPRAECASSTAPFIHKAPQQRKPKHPARPLVHTQLWFTPQHHKLFDKTQNEQILFFQQKKNSGHLNITYI